MPTKMLATPVNEKSGATLTVTHYDEDGALTTPATVQYRIDNPESGLEVRDWTSIATPASSYEITLTAADNTFQRNEARKEKRRVTLKATFSGGEPENCDCEYGINEVRFVNE